MNVGREEPIENAKPSGKTGIFKRPVEGDLEITFDGLTGDNISDTENHGGVDQAVYAFGAPDYAWWSEQLDRELQPGVFGENLTVSELWSAEARIGDRLRIGTTVLEIAAPRVPCVTLAARLGEPTFLKRFRRAERPGLYCRVIQEGRVRAGDGVEYEPYPADTISAIEMFRDFFEPQLNEKTLRRHLAAPVAIRDRVEKEKQLEALMRQKSVERARH